MRSLAALPSVHRLQQELQERLPEVPAERITGAVREAVQRAREALLAGEAVELERLPELVEESLREMLRPSLRQVINATGVVLHTNLGRAPLPEFAPLFGYSNLEYDLAAGRRGKRDAHTAGLLETLLGCAAIAVNNNAAAIFLALHELAAGGEVIVSRGELVEIGDGFRIPDIMRRSGAVLREVGTTNRTRIADYAEAVTDQTRLILRVHPSNFRVTGFTGKPRLEELTGLGRESGVPVYEDIGSGCLLDLRPYGIDEPRVQDSLRAGVDLISFSTDKLFGGPQAGLLAGRADLVGRLRRNPLFRTFRLDKLMVQALETTLRHFVLERLEEIPALRMLRMPADEIRARAKAVIDAWGQAEVRLVTGQSMMGGGSTPEQPLPTWLIAVPGPVARWERELRLGEPPVVARVENDHLLLDLRTVLPGEESALLRALQALS